MAHNDSIIICLYRSQKLLKRLNGTNINQLLNIATINLAYFTFNNS